MRLIKSKKEKIKRIGIRRFKGNIEIISWILWKLHLGRNFNAFKKWIKFNRVWLIEREKEKIVLLWTIRRRTKNINKFRKLIKVREPEIIRRAREEGGVGVGVGAETETVEKIRFSLIWSKNIII